LSFLDANKVCAARVDCLAVVFVLVCDMEARAMKMTMRTVLMAIVLMAGVGMAGAQIIDGSTGQMVDASTDPMDFSLVASGQPGNIGSEIAANDSAAFQATIDAQNQAQAQANADAASAPFTNNDDTSDDTPYVPPVPSTPKPALTPNGGSFKGSVQVAITDMDAAAKIFYTVNGKKPTTSSAIYAGPITVTAKEKVEALAFDVNDRPSGAVAKTFKLKG
jgi:hypothetical protein